LDRYFPNEINDWIDREHLKFELFENLSGEGASKRACFVSYENESLKYY
jgi:hypothetical protein